MLPLILHLHHHSDVRHNNVQHAGSYIQTTLGLGVILVTQFRGTSAIPPKVWLTWHPVDYKEQDYHLKPSKNGKQTDRAKFSNRLPTPFSDNHSAAQRYQLGLHAVLKSPIRASHCIAQRGGIPTSSQTSARKKRHLTWEHPLKRDSPHPSTYTSITRRRTTRSSSSSCHSSGIYRKSGTGET